MLRWHADRVCELDKGLLADTLNSYADELIKKDTIPSIVDGKDIGDKDLIIAELRTKARAIRSGAIKVVKLSLSDDWVTTTANVMLYVNRDKGQPVYRRAITVAHHTQKAFAPLITA